MRGNTPHTPLFKSTLKRLVKWISRAGDRRSISEQVGNDYNALLSSNVFPAYLLQHLFQLCLKCFFVSWGLPAPKPPGAEGKENLFIFKSVNFNRILWKFLINYVHNRCNKSTLIV